MLRKTKYLVISKVKFGILPNHHTSLPPSSSLLKSSAKVTKKSGDGGIDGITLANLMIEYNVGVNVKTVYEVKAIDSDFFDGE